jgi:hypothetical protein
MFLSSLWVRVHVIGLLGFVPAAGILFKAGAAMVPCETHDAHTVFREEHAPEGVTADFI